MKRRFLERRSKRVLFNSKEKDVKKEKETTKKLKIREEGGRETRYEYSEAYHT